MILSIPLESDLKSYVSDQGISVPVDVYAYLFYRMNGVYLIVTDDTDVDKEITSADVIGKLYSIDFDAVEVPDEFRSLQLKGVIVAESVRLSRPIQTTVKNINSNPSGYAFKRVKIQGVYLVTSYKIGYAEYDLQKHFGNGILADEFPSDDQSEVIETLDPVHTTWQVRQGGVIATVLYPTDEILDQFDYTSPQGIDEVKNELRPALLVEEIEHKTIPDVSIQELTSNPYQYDGDVVKITGYALGENVPVKEILKQINQNMKYIPVDVNILGVGIADGLTIGSQVILAGLNSELISEAEMILGRYEFEVAVTIQNVDAHDVPMLFLIEKKELPFEIPKNDTVVPTPTPTPTPKSGLLYVASSPSGASVYIDGTYKGATVASSYQPFYVDAGSHTIKMTMSGYGGYSTTEYISSGQTKYLYPTLDKITGTIQIYSNPAGANVYIDSTYVGQTITGSFQPFDVQAGSHTIKLIMTGYEEYSTTEYISSGQTKYVNTNLVGITPTPTPTPKSGLLYVASSPSGASVYIDGTYEGDTVAGYYQSFDVDAGSHTVKLTMSGYEEYSTTVYISSGQTEYLYPSLTGVTPTPTPTPASGLLYVISYPSGASVYIDEIYVGTTVADCYQSFYVESGSHTVKLTMSGYEDYSITEYIGQTLTLNIPLFEVVPTISVQSDPSGGSVYVDGNYEGTTESGEYLSIPVTTGYHTVTISKEGYEEYSKSVYSSGGINYVTAYLTAVPTISVQSDPSGGSVYVDGNYEGTTEGYEEYSKSVYFYSGDTAHLTAYLTVDAGTIWVCSDPAGGSVYVDGNNKGTTESGRYISISTTTGYHTVEISKDGYEDYSTSVYVYSADNEYVTAYLTAITGQMGVASDPPLAYIYIDGQYKGVTLEGQLQVFTVTAPGRYHVVLKNGDLRWESKNVCVYENTRTDVVVTASMW
jgi:hypothetical protein